MKNAESEALLKAAISAFDNPFLTFLPTRHYRSPEGYFSFAARLSLPGASLLSVEITPFPCHYRCTVVVSDWSMSSSGMTCVSSRMLKDSPTAEQIAEAMQKEFDRWAK